MTKYQTALLCAALAALPIRSQTEDSAWVQMFNGKDVADWTPKFSGHALGENPSNTFQFKAGTPPVLAVVETGAFNATGYGHFFYKVRTFSFYILRAEYRFTADASAPGFDDWTTQNNGLMLHAQTPASMSKDQEFPNSLEAQLLGPKSGLSPGTLNLCLPGTAAKNMQGGDMGFCTNSTSTNADRTQPWVTAVTKVYGDSLLQFFVGTKKVLEFQKPTVGGTALKQGYITIQAEGTSTEFRKIEILDLVGCMTKGQPGYRTYFVRHDAAKCSVTPVRPAPARLQGLRVERSGLSLSIAGGEAVSAELLRTDGVSLARSQADAAGSLRLSARQPGVYWLRVQARNGISAQKVALF